jgi:hypothetical protein
MHFILLFFTDVCLKTKNVIFLMSFLKVKIIAAYKQSLEATLNF